MTLFLLPNVLSSPVNYEDYLPKAVEAAVLSLDGLIAESEKGGRAFLRHFPTKKKAHEIPIALLNEHTPLNDMDFLLEPLLKGENWGVLSDGGLPCVADPGSSLVFRAKQLKVPIKTFPGPSSIMMSLVLSGLPGQRFYFHGYIAKDSSARKKELLQWEKLSLREKTTQIFIEAPYRNLYSLKECVEVLQPSTLLCVASALTTNEEIIKTAPISSWRKDPPLELGKEPTIFLFYS